MKKNLLLIFIFGLYFTSIQAQTRYIDEVFTNVTVASDVTYGTNITVITGMPASEDLKMDIYEPLGDTENSRPVIIVVHDGSFLPVETNGYCTGSKTDYQIVEMCTRLAKCGYVVAAIDFRLGWNPSSGDQNIRSGTYLNAFYRSVQDIHNAIRFFKWSVDNGNTYSVANNKFSVIGEGSGAMSALAVGCLTDSTELLLPKFINASTTNPFIDFSLSGNIEGTVTAPLTAANYPTYSSEVNFIGNLGGAVGDSTWIEAGEPPVVSFHCPSDPFNPYMFGAIIIPTTGDFLMNVSGSYDITRKMNSLGNNDVFINAGFNDTITQIANSRNNGRFGLYPFPRPSVESAPWQWWETSCTNNSYSMLTNPDMSELKAKAYIDTIVWYLTPRIAVSNGLYSGVEIEEMNTDNLVKIFPNPASDQISIKTIQADQEIMQVCIVDVSGRIMYFSSNIAKQMPIELNGFDEGLYFIKIQLKDGEIVKKLIIE